MLKWDNKKLTIIISKKQLIVASTIAVVCIVGLMAFYVHKKRMALEERRLGYYKRAASRLGGEMRLDPSIMEDKDKFPRYKRACNILRNNYFDNDVVALDFNIKDCGDSGTIIEIRYVAETTKVAQVFYTPHDDSGDIGHVFLTPNVMSQPGMWMLGLANLCILLKVDPKLSASDVPYDEWHDERLYLVVPQMTFDSIVNMKGQFVFLGKEGDVLDRFRLKELCSVVEQGD